MAEGDDPDLSLIDLSRERERYTGTGSHGDDQGYLVLRTDARDPLSGNEESYHALSLAYQDLKKRYNNLQSVSRNTHQRRSSTNTEVDMSRPHRTNSYSGSNENAPGERDFVDSHLTAITYGQSYPNASRNIHTHLEMDSGQPSPGIYSSAPNSLSRSEYTALDMDALVRDNRRLKQEVTDIQREKFSLQHKLEGFEQVYNQMTRGKAGSGHNLELERENMELQRQVKALEGAMREKRRQDSLSNSPRGRSPSLDNSLSSKDLQDLVCALMTSKEHIRQLNVQVRQQNEVIQMLINRGARQSLSASVPSAGLWGGQVNNAPITDEEISLLGARPKVRSTSPFSWSSDYFGSRQGVEHTQNDIPDFSSRQPGSHSEMNSPSVSENRQLRRQRLSGDELVNNVFDERVGPGRSRTLARRGSEGALPRSDYTNSSSPRRNGEEPQRTGKNGNVVNLHPSSNTTNREYSRRRPMSDGTSYGQFDIGVGGGIVPQTKSDSLDPLPEDDITPLNEELELEHHLLNLQENHSDAMNDRSVEHADTTASTINLNLAETPVNNAENHRQTSDNSSPRPLNIERNISYGERNTHRSYDNTRQNVNLNSGDHKYEPSAVGVNPGPTWPSVKPVPPRNVFNTQPNEETAVKAPPPATREEARCPICSVSFPSEDSEVARNRHVLDCLQKKEESTDLTLTPLSIESARSCPMCDVVFGNSLHEAEVMRHVNAHFGEHSIDPSGFEIIPGSLANEGKTADHYGKGPTKYGLRMKREKSKKLAFFDIFR